MHPQRNIIDAAQLIVEANTYEIPGGYYRPEATVRVLTNPSSNEITGLCNKADREGHGAGGGGVRWFIKDNDLHVWHHTETVHHDVHETMFGTTALQYHNMETHGTEVDDNHKPIKGTQFASGSFLRPIEGEPWHIGIRQKAAKDIIQNHPAFKHLLSHDGGKRKIERFDT
jgi:hypothetical protein